MNGPTFQLPGCPVCSHPPQPGFAGIVERPRWRFAARTSEKRKCRCYFWTGCAHAISIAPSAILDPVNAAEKMAAIESEWRHECERLIRKRTFKWPKPAKDALHVFLEDCPFSTQPHHAGATPETKTTNDT